MSAIRLSFRFKRLLPNEHGVTAIWLYSILAGFLSQRDHPSVVSSVFAAAVSFTLFLMISLAIRVPKVNRLVRSNGLVLTSGSVSLTSFFLFSHLILAGNIGDRDLAIWLLLASYTATATLSAIMKVRSLLSDSSCSSPVLLTGALILFLECILLVLSGLQRYTITLSLLILLLLAVINYLAKTSKDSKRSSTIRLLGLSYMVCGIAFATIISIQ